MNNITPNVAARATASSPWYDTFIETFFYVFGKTLLVIVALFWIVLSVVVSLCLAYILFYWIIYWPASLIARRNSRSSDGEEVGPMGSGERGYESVTHHEGNNLEGGSTLGDDSECEEPKEAEV